MSLVVAFTAAFILSFLGSIPPGTLNLTVIQLGLESKIKQAWRFAAAAALVEYPYAWAAIYFEDRISSIPELQNWMTLVAGSAMITFGLANLYFTQNPRLPRLAEGGFQRGVLASIFNPLALPFWMAATAYLRSINVVDLDTTSERQFYLIGVCTGAFALLIAVAYLSRMAIRYVRQDGWIRKTPAYVLIGLGIYAMVSYALD